MILSVIWSNSSSSTMFPSLSLLRVPPSVLLTFGIFESYTDFLTADGLGTCRKRRDFESLS